MADERDPEEIAEFEMLKRKALDSLPEVFAGTDWAPPEGGLLTEAVVIMVWMQPDGKSGSTIFPATNHWWSTRGMLEDALERHKSIRGDGSEPDEY